MEIVALIIADRALLVAFLTLRRAGSWQERLDQTASIVCGIAQALNETNEKLDAKLTDLRLDAAPAGRRDDLHPEDDHRRGDGGAPQGERGAGQLPPGRLLALRGQRCGHHRRRLPDLRH